MAILIHNISKLYTADEQRGYGAVRQIDHPQILIGDDLITDIRSAQKSAPAKPGDQILDGRGCCLLPGFVDAHTHPVFWKTREQEFIMRLTGKSYEEVAAAGGGIRNSAREFQKADKQEIKHLTARRLQVFLEYGTTTIEAKSGYGLTVSDELKALEIIAELNNEQPLQMIPTFLGAHDIPDAYRDRRQEYIRLVVEEMIPQVARRSLAEYCDVFCEQGVFSREESRYILETAKRYGLHTRIHADELHASGGAELAAEIGAATADHLIKVSEEGIAVLKKAGVIPILLPLTTLFLRQDGYAPARAFIDHDCPVALATDFNPGSSMTQNMQLVWSVAALKMGLLPGELLWSTTIIPARSLNRADRIGGIEKGKQADLIFLNIPNLDYLPYHIGINHVLMTMKKGKIVFNKNNQSVNL
jgi:imidazolonepropionase